MATRDPDPPFAVTALTPALGTRIDGVVLADGHPEFYRLSNLNSEGKPNGRHSDKGTLAWRTDGSWRRVTGHATIIYGESFRRPA